MIDELPKEISNALYKLWEYSDDACISGRTKDEANKEGYYMEEESGYKITFVISKGD